MIAAPRAPAICGSSGGIIFFGTSFCLNISHTKLTEYPICMFFLGSVKQKQGEEGLPIRESLPSLHSATFAPDAEPTIKTGIKTMTEAVLELMEKK